MCQVLSCRYLWANLSFWTILQFLSVNSLASIYEVANFTDPNSDSFNHLTVHDITGDVYIGGENQLYRLNENLEFIANITTGPEYDEKGKSHNTFSKILTINYDNDDLITCGGYRGVCQIRDLHDFSVIESGDDIHVASNKSYETTVGYVARSDALDGPMLYVGTTSTSSNPGSPFLSGRKLETDVFEVYRHDATATESKVEVSLDVSNTFPVSYVAGFSYGGYSYFITIQKSSTTSSNYISKLVRVCQKATTHMFNSYAEVPLRCGDDSYNLAQAAYLTRPAQDLSQSLMLNYMEEVLFISFSVGRNDPPTPTTKSAICMYKMSVIETAFQDAAEGCMKSPGGDERSAQWMRGASCPGGLPVSIYTFSSFWTRQGQNKSLNYGYF
ncbi:plexin-A2-like [Ptychodera flava]|uniref:plexin-A2-like n=1 Tax=Ptychodera flava TaxID=63121 RepID=UPI003969C0EE